MAAFASISRLKVNAAGVMPIIFAQAFDVHSGNSWPAVFSEGCIKWDN